MFDRINKGLWWDRAWTLVEGCTKVSPACDNCWAERESAMRRQHPNWKIRERFEDVVDPSGNWTGKIRLREDNLNFPLKVKKPTAFAVWNDLFHEKVPTDFIKEAFQVMYRCPQHIFFILTKRPEKALRLFTSKAVMDNIEFYRKALSHVWLGVTAENQEQVDKRIPVLLQMPVVKRFVSIEPMLSPVILDLPPKRFNEKEIDWVICGCESGKNRRHTDIDWIRNLRDQCQAAGVSFFLKQMEIDGRVVKAPELDGRQWLEIPDKEV